VRRGELRAIKLGGRGQWRVETAEVDRYVERLYDETREWIATHPSPRAPPRTSVTALLPAPTMSEHAVS
jgi:hypothetical protein